MSGSESGSEKTHIIPASFFLALTITLALTLALTLTLALALKREWLQLSAVRGARNKS
jgi:hypothetical protein